MSLLLARDDILDLHQQHQQQDERYETNSSDHAPFALQLRDCVVTCLDRERRVASMGDLQVQLKSPRAALDIATTEYQHQHHQQHLHQQHASPFQQLDQEVQFLREALHTLRVEKDAEIAALKEQLASRVSTDHALSCTTPTFSNVTPTHRVVPWMHSITERGDLHTSRLDRHASFKTVNALAKQQAIATSASSDNSSTGSRSGSGGGGTGLWRTNALAERVAAAFLDPVLSLPYLHSIQFGADLVELSAQVGALLENEARCLTLSSPVYVFGDLHGNYNDLKFFADHLWRFGFALSAGSFLFLGDYVDRGPASLECVAYLFAQKLLHPHKVFLLRGNHETRAVNGLEAYYGSGCFLSQCRSRFGHDEGYIVWHQINNAFDRLPLAATIDAAVFCVHGGIPRALGGERQLDSLRKLPATAPMDVIDKKFYDSNPQLAMVSDLIWGDPAKEEHEHALDAAGFGKSVQRGGNAVSFGTKAVDDFLAAHALSYVLRAHEATPDGVGVAKAARVFTIFSTSKDHGLGDGATCGCVLVDRDRLVAINRSSRQSHKLLRRRSVTSLPLTAVLRRIPSPTELTAESGIVDPIHESAFVAADASALRHEHSGAPAAPVCVARHRSNSSRHRAPSTRMPAQRRSEHAADECDSTDDEAPTPRGRESRLPSSIAPLPLHAAVASTASAPDGGNNQAEDLGE